MGVTTVTKGFRVEDVTFKNARKQSAIEDEIRAENPEMFVDDEIKAPVSLTPEQVINFYKQKIDVSKDSNEKRTYSQTIKWILELHDLRKKYNALESKLHLDVKEDYNNEIEDEE